VQEGVVAMADPLGVVTNLKLLDARGEALSAFQVAAHLNGLVHALPWQNEFNEHCITSTHRRPRSAASRYECGVGDSPKAPAHPSRRRDSRLRFKS